MCKVLESRGSKMLATFKDLRRARMIKAERVPKREVRGKG